MLRCSLIICKSQHQRKAHLSAHPLQALITGFDVLLEILCHKCNFHAVSQTHLSSCADDFVLTHIVHVLCFLLGSMCSQNGDTFTSYHFWCLGSGSFGSPTWININVLAPGLLVLSQGEILGVLFNWPHTKAISEPLKLTWFKRSPRLVDLYLGKHQNLYTKKEKMSYWFSVFTPLTSTSTSTHPPTYLFPLGIVMP